MRAQHTPGPWAVTRAGTTHGNQAPYAVIGAGECPELCEIARVGGSLTQPAEADARVMAAAPELLAALQKAVARQGFSNNELLSARAAIAKAVGHNAKITGG